MTPANASLEALAEAAVRAVAGWTDPPHRMAAEVRAALLAALPHLLLDAPDRDEYLRRLRAARQASGRVPALNAAAERVELPTDDILHDGVGGLTDEHLAVLAAEPFLLRNLAALIDEAAVAGEVGAVWWEAMGRAGAAAVASPTSGPSTADPALVARYRAVAALPRDDLFAAAAEVLRAAAPSDLLAGGTAEEFVRQWAGGRFAALCLKSDAGGTLLADLERADADPAELAVRVAALLRPRGGFAAVETGSLAALAVAVVEAIRDPG